MQIYTDDFDRTGVKDQWHGVGPARGMKLRLVGLDSTFWVFILKGHRKATPFDIDTVSFNSRKEAIEAFDSGTLELT